MYVTTTGVCILNIYSLDENLEPQYESGRFQPRNCKGGPGFRHPSFAFQLVSPRESDLIDPGTVNPHTR